MHCVIFLGVVSEQLHIQYHVVMVLVSVLTRRVEIGSLFNFAEHPFLACKFNRMTSLGLGLLEC